MEIATQIEDMARAAKAASPVVANASVDQRNAAPDTIVQKLATMQDREAPRSMLVLDDPDHARLRRLVTHAFNARAIDAMQQILWYTTSDDTLSAMLGRIGPALGLIGATTVICLVGARVAMSRWQ